MSLLGVYEVAELGSKVAELLGAHAVKGNETKLRVPDNYTNRIVLGLPLHDTKERKVPHDTDKLFDYQIEDVTEMINSTAYLNRNKPGYGKTIEAIVAAKNLNAKRILVIAPNPTVHQWVTQFRTWWPERTEDVYEASMTDKAILHDICVVNPEKVVSAKLRNLFCNTTWNILIVDEAHMLKNRKSLRTKTIKNIPAYYRWALTGTPILRNPDDLWSILDFLNPKYAGGSYWNFVRYYCEVEQTYFGEQIKGLTKNQKHVDTLHTLLNAISCYHPERQTEFGKTSISVSLAMDKKQQKLYNNVKKLVYAELPDDLTIANGAVLVTRLLQVTSAPGMFDDKLVGIKFEWILQFLKDNPTEKIVVYSRFEKAISLLFQYLNDSGIRSVMYTGKVNGQLRAYNKSRFISDPETRVLLGTIQAVGVGVDGLQKASHICVFLDKDFVPEMNNQCEDRLNRIEQKEEVLCYYLDCEKSWDLRVTQTNKMRISDIKRLLKEEE